MRLGDPTGLSPASASAKVLVVEDNFLVALELQRVLEEMGLRVVGPAASIGDGLALVEKEPIDAAILDVNIIGGTSATIAEELIRRGIPFFFVTGYGSPRSLPPALKERQRLAKPIDDNLLRVTVRRELCRASG